MFCLVSSWLVLSRLALVLWALRSCWLICSSSFCASVLSCVHSACWSCRQLSISCSIWATLSSVTLIGWLLPSVSSFWAISFWAFLIRCCLRRLSWLLASSSWSCRTLSCWRWVASCCSCWAFCCSAFWRYWSAVALACSAFSLSSWAALLALVMPLAISRGDKSLPSLSTAWRPVVAS